MCGSAFFYAGIDLVRRNLVTYSLVNHKLLNRSLLNCKDYVELADFIGILTVVDCVLPLRKV